MSAANARGKSITGTPLNDLLPDGMKAPALPEVGQGFRSMCCEWMAQRISIELREGGLHSWSLSDR